MWHVYAFIAADLIRERQREAAQDRLGRSSQGSPGVSDATGRGRPGWMRRRSAEALRRLAGAAIAISGMAGRAASRLEGRAA